MNLSIWAIVSLTISLTAGLLGYPRLLRRAAARVAQALFFAFLIVFLVLVLLVVIDHFGM